jgi:hypothetical protein
MVSRTVSLNRQCTTATVGHLLDNRIELFFLFILPYHTHSFMGQADLERCAVAITEDPSYLNTAHQLRKWVNLACSYIS